MRSWFAILIVTACSCSIWQTVRCQEDTNSTDDLQTPADDNAEVDANADTNADADADTSIDYSVLGRNSWRRFRPAWSLTVNDQCLYEFAFEFQHDPNLPRGELDFKGLCHIHSTDVYEEDGLPYLVPRPHWEQFPDYVWAAIGFQHLSIDWLACGSRPRGISAPHYALHFSRQRPEIRVAQLNCTLTLVPGQALHVGEKFCDGSPEGQNTVEGKRFYISPANAMFDRQYGVVNLPEGFTEQSAVPAQGLWYWNNRHILMEGNPEDWTSLPLAMATYDGGVAAWNVKIPYKQVSGPVDIFTSNAARYHMQTMDTLPDTWSVHYAVPVDNPDDFFANKDEDNNPDNNKSIGKIVYRMVGKSGLCRKEFDDAQQAAGGPPVFPNYDTEQEDDYTPVMIENNPGAPPKPNTTTTTDVEDSGENPDDGAQSDNNKDDSSAPLASSPWSAWSAVVIGVVALWIVV